MLWAGRARQTGYDTDGRGNLKQAPTLAGPLEKMVYDGEERQAVYCYGIAAGTACDGSYANKTVYHYDAEGRRVRREGVGGEAVFVYDGMGELALELAANSTGAGISYLTADQLGSTRVVTGADGAARECFDYLPFGQELNWPCGQSGGTRVRFTGKERDSDTGLDYFLARYYSGAQGRFTSTDEPFADQDPEDPQSWNLYSYGRNNPLRYVDPTGRAATVTVETDEENKRGRITVKASVAVYAEGLGKKAGESYTRAVKDQITKQWSGGFQQNGIKYDVKVEIGATFHQSESAALKSGADNVVELRSGPWDVDSSGNGVAGEVTPRPMGYSGPDRWALTMGGPAGHEFGHSMGIGIFGSVHHGGNNLMSAGAPANYATASDYGWAFGPSINRHRADQAVNPSLLGQPSSFRLQARPNYWIGR